MAFEPVGEPEESEGMGACGRTTHGVLSPGEHQTSGPQTRTMTQSLCNGNEAVGFWAPNFSG
jgi:hypothetical protein